MALSSRELPKVAHGKTARNDLDRIFINLKVHTRTEAAMLFAQHHNPFPSND